jgi:hypothetical protein
VAQTIDVSGLSPEAVRAVESLVEIIRDKSPKPTAPTCSIFDLFGKAPKLRTGEDIARQVEEEHDAWGEP